MNVEKTETGWHVTPSSPEEARALAVLFDSLRRGLREPPDGPRRAVLRALEAVRLATPDEIAAASGVPLDTVREILDDFVSPEIDLAYATTSGGRKAEGDGASLYFGLRG